MKNYGNDLCELHNEDFINNCKVDGHGFVDISKCKDARCGECGRKWETPNGHWRKVADELPEPFIPVLLKFPGGARRIGGYCFPSAGFISYGYKQKWTLKPIEWQPLPE